MENIIKFIQCIDLDAREFADLLGPQFEFYMSKYHSELVGMSIIHVYFLNDKFYY